MKKNMMPADKRLGQLEQYAQIISRMQIGMYVFRLDDRSDDRSLRLIDVNDASTVTLGLTRQESIGKRIDELFPRHRDIGTPARLAQVVISGTPADVEGVYYGNDRIPRHSFNYKAFALPDDCVCVLFEDITHRKQVEDDLRRAHEQLAAIAQKWETMFNSMSDGVALLSPDLKVMSINDTFCVMLGKKPADVIGKKCFEVVHGTDMPVAGCPCVAAFAIKKKCEAEIFEPGLKLWLSISASPVLDQDGSVAYMIHVVRNINDRKLMEEALRNRERELETLINDTPIPQFVIGADHRVKYWNKALAEISGIEAKDIVGTDLQWKAFYDGPRPCLADLLVDEKYDQIPEWYQNKFAQSRIITGAYEATDYFEMKGKQSRWLSFSAVAIKDSQGRIIGAIETLEDVTERKKAQDQLIVSEEQYRTLVNNLNVGIFRTTFDSGGRFIQANPAMARILGYDSVEEFMTMKAIDFYQNPDQGAAYVEEIRKNGAVRNREITLKRKDGSLIWVSISTQAYYNLKGGIDWIDGIAEDITERKRIQDALEKSEASYRELFNNSVVGIYQSTPEGRYIKANPALARIFGFDSPEEMISSVKNIQTDIYVHPEDRDRLKQLFAQNGIVENFEVEYKHRRGGTFWISINGKAVQDMSGHILYYEGTAQDITERKTAQEKLFLERAKYRDLVENMSSGVVIYEAANNGADFIIKDFNKAAEKIEKISRADVIGRNVSDAFPGVKDFGLYEVFKRVWETGKPEHFPIGMYQDQRISGWRENYVYKLPSGEVVAVYDDVTERKQAEEKVIQLNRDLEERVRQRTAQLEASMKELDAFSYSVSHDLQAPLRAISGFASIILEDHAASLNAQGKLQFERICSNAKKMSELISDLLSLSRLDRKEMHYSRVDMNGLVRQCTEELASAYSGRAVTFDIKPLAPVNADASLLHEVMMNLLANAVKFTRPREQAFIEVGSYIKDREQVYYVKDNGVGFDMEYVGKIFDPFIRLHHEGEFEGTGIGLNIVHRIIARHGGRLWAEAEPGKGAVFSFTLGGPAQ